MPPSLVVTATVDHVARVSPTFVRVWFTGPGLSEFGTPGQIYDQRIKVVLPGPSGLLPDLGDGDDWWPRWQALQAGERGAMRTYSIRDIEGEGDDTRLVIDFVLHLADGATGPASAWANAATPGDRVLLVGPRRGVVNGGVEFRPGDASTILLAGDETAAPAIARILLDLKPGPRGIAFIEVPDAGDALPLPDVPGFEVRWLPRDGASFGSRLIPSVLEHLGGRQREGVHDDDSEFPVWETPTYSGAGEEIRDDAGVPGLYVWVAGESGVVTTLRRHLVRDLGLSRRQVAFMGYWRQGTAAAG
ncbi:MAG: siderophore-interacting protein [Propioniciclava sp.]|uniref:siderophore-interacting protein n=1 Tax=Propioniciclava sp. TaxID=2038686 RepID=UPI0039E71A36